MSDSHIQFFFIVLSSEKMKETQFTFRGLQEFTFFLKHFSWTRTPLGLQAY